MTWNLLHALSKELCTHVLKGSLGQGLGWQEWNLRASQKAASILCVKDNDGLGHGGNSEGGRKRVYSKPRFWAKSFKWVEQKCFLFKSFLLNN